MNRGGLYSAVAAVLLSLLLHALGLGVSVRQDQTPETEDKTADVTDVGRTFEDFAEIITETAEPEPASVPEPPSVTSSEEVTEETPMTQALVASDSPQDVTAPDAGTGEVVEPDAAEPSASAAVTPNTSEQPVGEDDRAEDVEVLTPLEPEAMAEAPDGTQHDSSDPVEPDTVETAPVPPVETAAPAPSPSPALSPDTEAQQPVLPEIAVAPDPEEPETLTAQDSETATSSAVTTSLRPPKERPSLADSAVREGTPTGRATGTIESPLTAYKRTGVDPFASAGGGGRSGATEFSGARNPGNASTTNYAGQVLVQLNRFPPVDRSVRGAAQVSFGINPDGTVAWVNILRSTGHPGIRRAATAQVRRAAPFPPPPEGASQRMVFSYQRK